MSCTNKLNQQVDKMPNIDAFNFSMKSSERKTVQAYTCVFSILKYRKENQQKPYPHISYTQKH